MRIHNQGVYGYTEEEFVEFLNDPSTYESHGPPGLKSCSPFSDAPDLPEVWFEKWAGRFDRIAQDEIDVTRELLSHFVAAILGLNVHSNLGQVLDEIRDIETLIRVRLSSELFDFRVVTEPEVQSLTFSPEIYITPDFGNYYLTFLGILADAGRGINRLLACERCCKIALKTYARRHQRFCSDACRSHFHNKRKDPASHMRYMRKWRKDLKEQDSRIKSKLVTPSSDLQKDVD